MPRILLCLAFSWSLLVDVWPRAQQHDPREGIWGSPEPVGAAMGEREGKKWIWGSDHTQPKHIQATLAFVFLTRMSVVSETVPA